MARYTKQPTATAIGRGTTRDVDVSIEHNAVNPGTIRFRGGAQLTGVIINGSAVFGHAAGKRCIDVPSGIGNGLCFGYMFPLQILRPADAGAVNPRQGIVRMVSGMLKSGATGGAPNSDIGLDVLIGNPGGIADLWTANNSHLSGASGFSVQLDAAAVWKWKIKNPDTVSGLWAEDLALPAAVQAQLNSLTTAGIVEFRMYDATFALEAKCELYIDGALILTRYWTNPAGVVTPVLPPMGPNGVGVTGNLLTFQMRNTSQGPPHMYFLDPCMIIGANDAGTL